MKGVGCEVYAAVDTNMVGSVFCLALDPLQPFVSTFIRFVGLWVYQLLIIFYSLFDSVTVFRCSGLSPGSLARFTFHPAPPFSSSFLRPRAYR